MKTNDQGMITGHLRTYQHSVRFALRPIPQAERKSDKAPSFEILAKAPHGDWVEVGTGRDYEMKRGEFSGESMINLWFNDPVFGDGLGVAAFPVNTMGDYRLQLDRKRDQDKGDQPAQGNAEFDDNIPF